MSETSISEGGPLVEFYHRYVGEPESKRDVYGYWIFLLGALAGLVSLGLYLTAEVLAGSNYPVRRIAISVALSGGAIALLGIVVLLPVRRRGIFVSVVGVAVALATLPVFWQQYPNNFNVEQDTFIPVIAADGGDWAALIVAWYGVGLGTIAAVAVLVPIVTGEKGLLVEPELGLASDEPPVLIGEAKEDAFFAVFETPDNEWAWRVIRRDAIGESAQLTPTDTDARMAIESVRGQIADAGLLEITTAAFRLYRTEDDQWRWTLVRNDGSVLAESDEHHTTRDEAESTVTFLKEAVPGAEEVEIRGAAFDVYQDDAGRWHWRLVDDQRQPLAAGPDSYAGETAANGGIDQFVDKVDVGRVLALDNIGIELFDDDGHWRWRIIDADDRRLVTSTGTFGSRREAEEAAFDVAEEVSDATVIEHGSPGFEVFPVGDDYRWRLRDDADDLIATSYEDAGSEQDAVEAAGRTREAVASADVIEFEGADYEVYPQDNAWHWRLVADDRSILADSTDPFDDRQTAEEAANRVREQALAADLIEFEQAAFQQYESGGQWRWRLIDEDGQVLSDSGEEYGSREEVMDGMTTLKEHAPDAEVLEIETAAFEIYRTDAGDYAWRLIDETGKLVAEGTDTHSSRAGARDAVDFILEHLDQANVRPMESPAFQLSTDAERDEWFWWLVDTDGSVLAEGLDDNPTRDDARSVVQDVREAGEDADIDVMGPATIQLRNGGGWHWRIIDRDRQPIADGERTYEGRQEAVDDARTVTREATDAPVFELGDGVYWVNQTAEGWQWRLLDSDREEVAASIRSYETEEEAIDAVEVVQARAPEATLLEIDTLAFDLYMDEAEAWHWQLLNEDERVLARSAGGYDHRDAIEDAMQEVRDVVTDASILEIDEAAFEFHERDGGWIWRLVDENGNPLAESVQPHGSRQEAREEMLTVKEHGPDGETVVTW